MSSLIASVMQNTFFFLSQVEEAKVQERKVSLQMEERGSEVIRYIIGPQLPSKTFIFECHPHFFQFTRA